jgi:putative ABC transport system permease protein
MIGPILRAISHKPAAAVLIILEVGFGFAVAVQAVNLGRWFARVHADPSGIDENVFVVCSESAAPERERTDADRERDRDMAVLNGTPGVVVVAPVRRAPMARGVFASPVRDGGRTFVFWPLDGTRTRDALGVPLVEGRDLTAGDVGRDPEPVLVDRDAAELLAPGESALGRTFELTGRARRVRVVGVTASFRAISAFAPYAHDTMIVPDEVGSLRSSAFVVRTEPGATPNAMAEARTRLAAANPDRALVMTAMPDMREDVDRSARGGAAIFNLMVVVIILVVLSGTFAMVSYLVAERTKQIGMRRALGATRRDIIKFFLQENELLTVFGILLGLPLTYGLNLLARVAQPDLYMDWQSVALAVLIFICTGHAAAIIPALRAANVPPTVATKSV